MTGSLDEIKDFVGSDSAQTSNMSSTDKSLPTVISVPTVKSINNMMSGKLTVDEDREIGDVNSGEFFIHFHI